MTFRDSISSVLSHNYFNFRGTASRSEFFWYCLFYCIIVFLIIYIFYDNYYGYYYSMGVLSWLGIIAIFLLSIPIIPLTVRRLHDSNLSGYIALVLFISFLIPLVGIIVPFAYIYFMCRNPVRPTKYETQSNITNKKQKFSIERRLYKTHNELKDKSNTIIETTISPNENILNKGTVWKKLFDHLVTTSNSINQIGSLINEIEFKDPSFVANLNDYSNQLKAIEEKLNDNHFYIGIFGEFSCGKSTFINALTEHRCLTEDITQGTTCAPTIIEFSEQENVIVKYKNGKEDRLINDRAAFINKILEKVGIKLKKHNFSEKELKEFINKTTAVEENSKFINEVIWCSPINVLKSGITIIDTPGIGSLNERHTEVAKKAVSRCDANLILTNLNASPLSESLIKEVKIIAGDNADRCIFVGTHSDNLPDKELDRMSKFFDIKLKGQFNKQKPKFFVSAYKALEVLFPSDNKNVDSSYLYEFRDFRNKIITMIENHREYIQCGNIVNLVSDLLPKIDKELSNETEVLSKKIDEFKLKVLDKDAPQWGAWKKKLQHDFKSDSKNIYVETVHEANEIIDDLRQSIKSAIFSCKDTNSLKSYLESGINSSLSTYSEKLEGLIKDMANSKIPNSLANALKEYKKNISENFNELEQIFGGIKISKMGAIDSTPSSVSINSGEMTSLSKKFDEQENSSIGKGLAAGIAVSLVIPGAGWIAAGVLAILGGIIGTFFGPSLDERKEDAVSKIDEKINELRESISSQITAVNDQLMDKSKNYLNKIVNEQYVGYSNYIDLFNKNIIEVSKDLKNIQNKVNSYRNSLSNQINELKIIDSNIKENLDF